MQGPRVDDPYRQVGSEENRENDSEPSASGKAEEKIGEKSHDKRRIHTTTNCATN
jgi:hypothetical protein